MRSFLVQGSWNFRTLLGTGFAFALLPVLKKLHAGDRDALERATLRSSGYFNTHPYFSPLLLGATARLECEGTDPDEIERLKQAGGSALGGLGDALIWGALLPLSSVLALFLWFAGTASAATLAIFLVVFNFGHLLLRKWALSTGIRHGHRFARHLGRSRFDAWIRTTRSVAALAVGMLIGTLVTMGPTRLVGVFGDTDPAFGPWEAALVPVALAAGAAFGRRAWRPSALIVVALVAGAFAWGGLT